MSPASTTEAPRAPAALAERLALVDAVDHLLNRGAVLVGEATVSLAGVDLVYLGLNVLVSSVETLRRERPEESSQPGAGPARVPPRQPLGVSGPSPAPALPARGAGESAPGWGPPGAASLDLPTAGATGEPAAPTDRPEQGLARLVLTLVELLRQVIERQAVRRMEGGSLSDDEVERMGLALMELEAKMTELRDVFGLGPDDLNVDLGPLGKLL
jgi:hypothetical protein